MRLLFALIVGLALSASAEYVDRDGTKRMGEAPDILGTVAEQQNIVGWIVADNHGWMVHPPMYPVVSYDKEKKLVGIIGRKDGELHLVPAAKLIHLVAISAGMPRAQFDYLISTESQMEVISETAARVTLLNRSERTSSQFQEVKSKTRSWTRYGDTVYEDPQPTVGVQTVKVTARVETKMQATFDAQGKLISYKTIDRQAYSDDQQ